MCDINLKSDIFQSVVGWQPLLLPLIFGVCRMKNEQCHVESGTFFNPCYCHFCIRNAMCCSSRIISTYIMPVLYTMFNICIFWLVQSPDLSIIKYVWGIIRWNLTCSVIYLQFLLYCINRCERHGIMPYRMVFAFYMITYIQEYKEDIQCIKMIPEYCWHTPYFGNSTCIYVYEIICHNPAILPVHLILSKLKHIKSIAILFSTSVVQFIYQWLIK